MFVALKVNNQVCTTSAECRTVMIAVLIVMSGMDPHTIRVTWIGMVGMLEVGLKDKSFWH
jgi:hypothetical protein